MWVSPNFLTCTCSPKLQVNTRNGSEETAYVCFNNHLDVGTPAYLFAWPLLDVARSTCYPSARVEHMGGSLSTGLSSPIVPWCRVWSRGDILCFHTGLAFAQHTSQQCPLRMTNWPITTLSLSSSLDSPDHFHRLVSSRELGSLTQMNWAHPQGDFNSDLWCLFWFPKACTNK